MPRRSPAAVVSLTPLDLTTAVSMPPRLTLFTRRAAYWAAVATCGYVFARPTHMSSLLAAEPAARTTLVTAANQPPQTTGREIDLPLCVVYASEQVDVAAPQGGLVREVAVSVGQDVNSGEILAAIDDAEFRGQLAVAHQQTKIAQQTASDTTAIDLADGLIRTAEVSLEAYRAIDRRGSATPAELRQRELALEQAKLQLSHAQAERHTRRLAAELAFLQAQMLEAKLPQFSIKSPSPAVVAAVEKSAGEWVQPGEPLVRLQRLDEVRVDSFVALKDEHPGRLVGRSVWVTLQRGGETLRFAGRVASYDPQVSAESTTRVHAVVQNLRRDGHWLLLPGMHVRMQILAANR